MTVLADPPGTTAEPPQPAGRPLAVAGSMAAAWSVGIGLATLTTITLAGWVAAPRAALGPGLPGVFRAAVNLWLVAHHAGFALPGGRVGLLPLGLMVLPGALLFRGGAWITRESTAPGLRKVGVAHAAIALAVPYTGLLTLLAFVAGTTIVRPSVWQAVLNGFLLALAAGGLGSARVLVTAAGGRMSWAGLLRLLPERPRALVVGVTGATLVLLAGGAALTAASLAAHLQQAERLQAALAPGVVGGVLLFLLELVFLPNAVIWGMSYAIGPGFAVGSGTSVSPSGIYLGEIPAFPPLAALPDPGPAPLISLVALLVPFVAGVVGGVLTVRTVPTPVPESAPLWGFACGTLTGAVATVLALLSAGPLGGGRLTAMGPSAWQVGLMATLEVGVAAAVAAWVTNWRLLRRLPVTDHEEPPEPDPIPDSVEFVAPEPVLAAEPDSASRRRSPRRGPRREPGRASAPAAEPADPGDVRAAARTRERDDAGPDTGTPTEPAETGSAGGPTAREPGAEPPGSPRTGPVDGTADAGEAAGRSGDESARGKRPGRTGAPGGGTGERRSGRSGAAEGRSGRGETGKGTRGASRSERGVSRSERGGSRSRRGEGRSGRTEADEGRSGRGDPGTSRAEPSRAEPSKTERSEAGEAEQGEPDQSKAARPKGARGGREGGKVETRGGAIFVLRDDVPEDPPDRS